MNKRERRDFKKNTTWIKFITDKGAFVCRVRLKKSDLKLFADSARKMDISLEAYIVETLYDYVTARSNAAD